MAEEVAHPEIPMPVTFRGSVGELETKARGNAILEAALTEIRSRPGFSPAAISVVFGLKW